MLGTIVLEKMLDVISYAILALLVVFWMPMPAWVRGSVAGVTVVGVSLALGLFAISHLRKHAVMIPDGLAGWLDQTRQKFASSRPGQKLFTWLQMGSESLKILDKPGQLLLVIVCTAVVWGTALLTNLLVLQAFELGLNFSPNGFLASLLVLVGLIAGISIPSVPGRIGIFEYICVLSLQLFSVPAAMGLSYGILLHAVVFIPQSVAGLISLLASGLPARAKSL